MSYKQKIIPKDKGEGNVSLSIALSEMALLIIDLNPVEVQQLIIELENIQRNNEKI